jgi:hypothetical protein
VLASHAAEAAAPAGAGPTVRPAPASSAPE